MIKISSLSLWAGEKQILYDVSAYFAQNSATALLGPSGSGKSTLIKSINRIHDEHEVRYSGSITLNGEELLKSGVYLPEIRRRVGMVFQTPCPFDMSIEKNVAYGIRLHENLSRAELECRVQEALFDAALFDEVKDRLKESAMSLSGGQRQRLCIARALAVRPQVLLMDEPTSALDPLSTEKIEKLIIKLKRRLTIILVTHSAKQALRCCDFAIMMKRGRVCESGGAKEVILTPRSREARQFFESGLR